MTISWGEKRKKKKEKGGVGGGSAGQYKTPDDGKNIGKQYLEQMHSHIIQS